MNDLQFSFTSNDGITQLEMASDYQPLTHPTSTPAMPTPYDPGNWGKRVDIKTIGRVRVPVRGPDTWRPLPHDTFVTMIEEAFSRHGFTISEPVHYMAAARGNDKIHDQSEYGRFLSMYGITHPGLPDHPDFTWEAGFANSYDMSTAAGGGLGRRVMVCSNGLYMGTVTAGFKRKHTKGIDADRTGGFESVYDLVNTSVGNLQEEATKEVVRIDRWKNTECRESDARWVILEAAKKGVIGAAATLRVLEHWEQPEHPEFKDRNLWSLENAFTEYDKGRNLLTQADRFGKLHTAFDTRFSFAEPANASDF